MDDHRNFSNSDLAELVSSRLCHDLVNPLSAISNGLELLALSGATKSPEIELIGDAVEDALARIRFFRLAFGALRADETISERETRETLRALYSKARLQVAWCAEGDLSRAEVKRAFLLLACVETALPLGGEARIERQEGIWRISGTARKINYDGALWQALEGPGEPILPPAAKVQFALLQRECQNSGSTVRYEFSSDEERFQVEIVPL